MEKRGKPAKEKYLLTIFELEEHEKKGVKSIDIAKKFNISKPSVSEMLGKLTDDKLIKMQKYKKIFFTKKGRKIAEKLFDNHYTIKRFMKHIIQHDDEKAKQEAHKISHLLENETIERIEKLMEGKLVEPEQIMKPLPSYIG